MNFNIKAIAKIISLATIFSGITNMIPAAVSYIYGENVTGSTFLICGLAYAAAGSILYIFMKEPGERLRPRDGILTVSIAWVVMIILGASTLTLTTDINFGDAFFESSSGFTTTGASVIDDVEALPRGVLFYRSLSQWIGGFGIIVLVISIIPAFGGGSQIIARAEGSRSYTEKIFAKYTDMGKRLFLYYAILTVSFVLLLLPGRMDLFDSITHAMNTVSTGGFSNYNEGIINSEGFYEYWITILFMIFGSINFTLFYYLFSVHWKYFFKDTELRWFMVLISTFSILIIIDLWATGTVSSIAGTVTHGAFNLVSIMTTTGFASTDFNLWPAFACMLLFIAMAVGGCSASASGGIKVFRIVILLKLIKRNISGRLHPNALISIKDDDGPLPSDLVSSVAAYIFMYITMIFFGSLLLAVENHDFITTVSSVISCLGNIGPGFGDVGPMNNYDGFSLFGKLVLSFMMIAGRLELFGLMLIFMRSFWNPDRVRI